MLTYLFHSGFLFEAKSAFLVFDFFLDGAYANQLRPWQGVAPKVSTQAAPCALMLREDSAWLRPQEADKSKVGVVCQVLERIVDSNKPCYFLASHFHQDHFQPCIVEFYRYFKKLCAHKQCPNPIHLVLSRDIARYRKFVVKDVLDEIYWMRRGDCLDLPEVKIEAFGSTDVGVSWVCQIDGKVIFHAGDLNDWHWMSCSSPEEIASAHAKFDKELQKIKQVHHAFDVAMFPCDVRMGQGYLLGPQKFLQTFQVGCLVPMHTWEKFPELQKDLAQCSWLSPQQQIWIPRWSGDFTQV